MIDLQRFFSKVGALLTGSCASEETDGFTIQIASKKYDAGMKGVLRALIENLEKDPLNKASKVTWELYPVEQFSSSDNLTQDYLWSASIPI